eukprot:scaffold10382_cov65-Phaeocystis_antarctica.AAC.3
MLVSARGTGDENDMGYRMYSCWREGMKAERTHGNKRASRAAWVPLNWGVCTASTRSLAVFARLSARLRSVESVGWMAAMRLGTARARARQKLTEQERKT